MPRLLRTLAVVIIAAPLAFSAHAHEKKEQKAENPVVDHQLLSRAPLPSDHVMGSKDAPVKLIEYASMSCPHCAHFHKEVLPEIKKNYIETGKVLFIFRPYPLNEPALKASQLIECVGQDSGSERYFTFLRVLFESQNKWAFEGNYLASLETFAKVGGVSKERFDACMKDTAVEMKVLGMKKDATDDLGVDRTPTIFLNNRRYTGDLSVAAVTSYLDKLLGKDAPVSDEPKMPKKK